MRLPETNLLMVGAAILITSSTSWQRKSGFAVALLGTLLLNDVWLDELLVVGAVLVFALMLGQVWLSMLRVS